MKILLFAISLLTQDKMGNPAGGRAVAGSNPVSPTQGPEESRVLREPQEAAEIPAPEAILALRTAP
jgi:hypothetical protein